MRMRFILSETWTSLKRNVPMIISVMLVTFISFVFIGASALLQVQVNKAKGDWYSKVEVVVYLCPDGSSQAATCAAGKAPTQQEIVELEDFIHQELRDNVSKITYVSRDDFYKDTFLKKYPDGKYQGRTLTAADMQDSLQLKLKDPTKYKMVSEVLSGKTGVESVVDQKQIPAAACCICFAAVFLGSFLAAKHTAGKRLPAALAVAGCCFAVCFLARLTAFGNTQAHMLTPAVCMLAAALLAGILGGTRKKSARRRRR